MVYGLWFMVYGLGFRVVFVPVEIDGCPSAGVLEVRPRCESVYVVEDRDPASERGLLPRPLQNVAVLHAASEGHQRPGRLRLRLHSG